MQALTGRIHHDEDVTVYFNGVMAFQESGYLTSYKNISIKQEALDALTPDDTNIIAIECTNKGGGQYIDFGLSGIRPLPTKILNVEHSPLNIEHSVYDLQGRKVVNDQSAMVSGQLPKGVYIVNGKKILF
jgi:hypothetical protein